MRFDPTAYGPEVAAILALDGDGERLMPLGHGQRSSPAVKVFSEKLFPEVIVSVHGPRSCHEVKGAIEVLAQRKLQPEAALAGLYLYFSCWEEAHQIAQDIPTPEGSYWHAIVHRQEPDAGNSGYWFRQVGEHPIFPALRQQAAQIGVDFGPRWDPIAFIEMCEHARQEPGSDAERMAVHTQRAEWQLLFDYCAAKTGRARASFP